MEQFVLVPASVYNNGRSSKTQFVKKKHELPKCQGGPTSTYQIDSLQKVNKQKAVCQSRLFSRQSVVLSPYEALNFSDFDIGWCENWKFTVRFCSTNSSKKRRRSRRLFYFLTLLVYLQLQLWIKMPKPRREEAGSLSKYERQKLRKLYTRWCCLWVCAPFSESNQPTSIKGETIFTIEIFVHKV